MRTDTLLRQLRSLAPALAAGAPARDAAARFPAEALAELAGIGLLLAPLPARHGGAGLGTEPGTGADAATVLRCLGGADLSLARLFEAHLNAAKLVRLYGTDAHLSAFAADAAAGHAHGLWVTDAPADPARWADGALRGTKSICSGAGHLRRALITVAAPGGGTRLALLRVEPKAEPGPELAGLRAAVSGPVRLEGIPLPEADLVGADGDYLRQPEFSAGAWRGSAAASGAVAEANRLLAATLRARGRDRDPHQLARLGEALIAEETAALFVSKAARVAEDGTEPAEDVSAYVNLARMAVEAAALRATTVVTRSLGLSAFRRGERAELVLRDLATYLRQPAPDETLAEAAARFAHREMPR